jgi:repressor LexA
MQGLTKRQREIVDFIEAYLSENRHSPSYREIQNHFGFSSLGSVYNHIQSLKKRGYVAGHTEQSRSLQLVAEQKESVVPLIGKLRGGMPIETYPEVSMIAIPPQMIPSHLGCYVLRVVGSELEEERIAEGDLLLVHSKSDFEDNEMILVQVEGQTTLVKRGFLDPPYMRLESSDPEVQPLILREDHVQILGTIHALIRNYS